MLFVRTTHDWAGGGIVYSGGKNDRQTAALVRTGDLFRSTCLTFFSLSLSLFPPQLDHHNNSTEEEEAKTM